jgi:hypothetical protein
MRKLIFLWLLCLGFSSYGQSVITELWSKEDSVAKTRPTLPSGYGSFYYNKYKNQWWVNENGTRRRAFPTITATVPSGSDTYIQYNNSGAFGGSSAFTWNSTYMQIGTSPYAKYYNNTIDASGVYLISASSTLDLFGSTGLTIQTNGAVSIGSGSTTGITSNKKHTFTTSSTNPPINLGSYAGNPSSLNNYDIWFNSSTGHLYGRIGGVSYQLDQQSSSTPPAGSNTQVQYNNSGAFGAGSDFVYGGSGSIIMTSGGASAQYAGASVAYTAGLNISGTGTLTLDGTTGVTVTPSLRNSTLTSGRVPYISTGGLFVDNSNFTYNGSVLTSPQLSIGGSSFAGYIFSAPVASSYTGYTFKGGAGDSGVNSGGLFYIGGGDGYSTSGNGDGGSVYIDGGSKRAAGSGHNGDVTIGADNGGTSHTRYIILKNVPTSSAGLPSGAVWSNSGVLTIIP